MKSADDIKIEALYDNLLEEAKKKKKVNPWAIANSMANKKGLSSKKKEEIVKGIKRGAKKAGTTITSESIEEASPMPRYESGDIFEEYETVGMSAEMGIDELIQATSEDIWSQVPKERQKEAVEAVKELWMSKLQEWNIFGYQGYSKE